MHRLGIPLIDPVHRTNPSTPIAHPAAGGMGLRSQIERLNRQARPGAALSQAGTIPGPRFNGSLAGRSSEALSSSRSGTEARPLDFRSLPSSSAGRSRLHGGNEPPTPGLLRSPNRFHLAVRIGCRHSGPTAPSQNGRSGGPVTCGWSIVSIDSCTENAMRSRTKGVQGLETLLRRSEIRHLTLWGTGS